MFEEPSFAKIAANRFNYVVLSHTTPPIKFITSLNLNFTVTDASSYISSTRLPSPLFSPSSSFSPSPSSSRHRLQTLISSSSPLVLREQNKGGSPHCWDLLVDSRFLFPPFYLSPVIRSRSDMHILIPTTFT